MRTIIVVLFLLLYTIVSLPMYLIGFILGKMDPKKKVRMSQRFVAGGFRCILFLSGVKVTVKGKENQIHDKAALYVFNHRSFFYIVVGYATAPIPSAFVSKKEIEKLITDLTKQMKEVFVESFDQINKNFTYTFKELFGGGTASLSLADPDCYKS